MITKKNGLILFLALVFVLGFANIALASVTLQVDPYEPTASWANDYCITWDIIMMGDPGTYYIIEILHDGDVSVTYNNILYATHMYIDDTWYPESVGWHQADFKVYKQDGYNTFRKASGVLAQRSTYVYRDY